jgi:preprotein translocase subunit YajC
MGMMLILPLLLFGLIILMNRSDKKRRSEIESKLKKGDRVVTRAGFIGKVVEVGEKNARVEIAPGVVVRMVKTAIEGLADEESAKKDAAKKDDDKGDKDAKKKK